MPIARIMCSLWVQLLSLLILSQVAHCELSCEPVFVSDDDYLNFDCPYKIFKTLNYSNPIKIIESTNFYTTAGVQFKECHNETFVSPIGTNHWQKLPSNVKISSLYYYAYERGGTWRVMDMLVEGFLPDGYTHLHKNLQRLERSYMHSRYIGVSLFVIKYHDGDVLSLFHFGKFKPGIYEGSVYHFNDLEDESVLGIIISAVEKYFPGFWVWDFVMKLFGVDLDLTVRESIDNLRDFLWDIADEVTRDTILAFFFNLRTFISKT